MRSQRAKYKNKTKMERSEIASLAGRFAFVKARLLNKEALALRRQRSTAIPVVFFAVAFLKSLSACNRGGFAASVVFVRSALVDQFGRAWSFTMVVVEVAHVFVLGSQVRERIKAFDGLGVWVGAGVHVPPHDYDEEVQRGRGETKHNGSGAFGK